MSSASRSALRGKLGLYMVTTEAPGRGHLDVAEAAIAGGAGIIQYRDKGTSPVSSQVMYERAMALRELTRRAGALLIVNDRLDIALAVGADGVHLGQDDVSHEAARQIMGQHYIIGISATTLEEAVGAAGAGADYVGLGPIFPTPSKDDAAQPMGLEGLVAARRAVDLPIVAIGGITIDNSEDVVTAGADGVAVISAVASAPDMIAAARDLSERIARAKNR